MTILWLNLISVFMMSFFARYFSTYSVGKLAPYFVKPNKLLTVGALTSLVLTSGLRSNIGDTYVYKNIYIDNEFTWDYIFSQKDYGFSILQMILKSYISNDPQVMLFTTALMTNLCIVIVFYHYSRMLEISLYVYITGGLFLVSMNGIRQMLAAAISFVAIKYLINGNFIKYSLIILLASTFHQSALILIPIYFLVRFKAWSKVTVTVIIVAVLAVIGFEQFSTLLFTALEDTQYSGYEDFDEGGSNIIRSIVAGVPIFIAYLGRRKLNDIFPNNDYIVNMAILGFVFMLISTQSWIFARISLYFELYLLILVSWIVELFPKKDGKIIYYGIITCYFLYYYYESVINLNILYRSDYIVW